MEKYFRQAHLHDLIVANYVARGDLPDFLLEEMHNIVYNSTMAKRNTGLTNKNKKHPYKTQKRLAAKREMLAQKAAKSRK